MQLSKETRDKRLVQERQATGAAYTALGKKYGMTAVHARRVFLQAQAAKNRKARESLRKMLAKKDRPSWHFRTPKERS